MLEENYLETNTHKQLIVTIHSGSHNIKLVTTPLLSCHTQHALDGRRKLFEDEHAQTADSYYSLGVTQHYLGDYTSALQ